MKICITLFVFLLVLSGCYKQEKDPTAYEREIERWRMQRLAELKATTVWLALAGLFWLQEGSNRFGSSDENDLVFPENAADRLGTFMKNGDSITMEVADGQMVTKGGINVRFSTLTVSKNPERFWSGSLWWHLLKRNDRFGIRLGDSSRIQRTNPISIPSYPIDSRWRLQATFVPSDSNETVTLRNILDMDMTMAVEGRLVFELDGGSHSLIALDGGPDKFLVVFGDATTGSTTYGGGRYIYPERPVVGNNTVIDFNKAHNPPCVFTDYATCLRPSSENMLDFAVRAGEKDPDLL